MKQDGIAVSQRDKAHLSWNWAQVRWPSSRCDEVRGVGWFMESRQFLSKLHTDHEPGRVG
jgi:hypothetical protein